MLYSTTLGVPRSFHIEGKRRHARFLPGGGRAIGAWDREKKVRKLCSRPSHIEDPEGKDIETETSLFLDLNRRFHLVGRTGGRT